MGDCAWKHHPQFGRGQSVCRTTLKNEGLAFGAELCKTNEIACKRSRPICSSGFKLLIVGTSFDRVMLKAILCGAHQRAKRHRRKARSWLDPLHLIVLLPSVLVTACTSNCLNHAE